MPIVTIRELANATKAVVEAVITSGRPTVVTRRGKPIVAIVSIDEATLEGWVLATVRQSAPATVQPGQWARPGDTAVLPGGRRATLEEVVALRDQLRTHAEPQSGG
jgi:prevent-host-death family protein